MRARLVQRHRPFRHTDREVCRRPWPDAARRCSRACDPPPCLACLRQGPADAWDGYAPARPSKMLTCRGRAHISRSGRAQGRAADFGTSVSRGGDVRSRRTCRPERRRWHRCWRSRAGAGLSTSMGGRERGSPLQPAHARRGRCPRDADHQRRREREPRCCSGCGALGGRRIIEMSAGGAS